MFQRDVRDKIKSHMDADWNRVSSVKFVADRSGKFVFRCTETCGNLHPFMTGELIVRPNVFYHLFVSFSIWMVFSMWIQFRYRSKAENAGTRRINILEKFPRLSRLVNSRSFQFLFVLPNLIVFYLFLLSSLWESPVGNRNIAIVFVWILWWFVLKAIIVPVGGRLWCMVCPLPAPAEWLSRRRLTTVKYIETPFRKLHHRFTGLQKDWPKKLRNIWLQNILFLIPWVWGGIYWARPICTSAPSYRIGYL